MSSGKRAYDLLRGYVNQEWERIRGVPDNDAETELNQAMSVSRLRRERTAVSAQEMTPVDPQGWARNILGVAPTAEFEEIRRVYVRLNTRSDPSKFPEGSVEARQASEIQLQIQRAYVILTEDEDTTVMRFKSLELD